MAINWDNADLAVVAKEVRDAYFSFKQSELLGYPLPFRARCLQAISSPQWDDHAATILMLIHRTAWEERKDEGELLALKQLFEESLRSNSALSEKIAHALSSGAQHELKREMRQRGIPESVLDENPMDAIEQCFFLGAEGSRSQYLTGALLLTNYRHIALECDPSGYLATLFAFREAFGYFHAEMPAAGQGCINWALEKAASIEAQLDSQAKEQLATCICYSAHAAEQANAGDAALRMWRASTRFVPDRGDTRAECFFGLGKGLEQRGLLADAARAYRLAMETPGITDNDLAKVIRISMSSLRAQLEGDTRKLTFDAELGVAAGIPKGLGPSLKVMAGKLMAGETIPDKELQVGAESIAQWLASRQSLGVEDASDLRLANMILKLRLSASSQAGFATSFNTALSDGQRFLAKGSTADQLEFKTLRDHIVNVVLVDPK